MRRGGASAPRRQARGRPPALGGEAAATVASDGIGRGLCHGRACMATDREQPHGGRPTPAPRPARQDFEHDVHFLRQPMGATADRRAGGCSGEGLRCARQRPVGVRPRSDPVPSGGVRIQHGTSSWGRRHTDRCAATAVRSGRECRSGCSACLPPVARAPQRPAPPFASAGLSRLLRPAGEHAVEQGVGQQAQQLGHDGHLPGDDAVALLRSNGAVGALCKRGC